MLLCIVSFWFCSGVKMSPLGGALGAYPPRWCTSSTLQLDAPWKQKILFIRASGGVIAFKAVQEAIWSTPCLPSYIIKGTGAFGGAVGWLQRWHYRRLWCSTLVLACYPHGNVMDRWIHLVTCRMDANPRWRVVGESKNPKNREFVFSHVQGYWHKMPLEVLWRSILRWQRTWDLRWHLCWCQSCRKAVEASRNVSDWSWGAQRYWRKRWLIFRAHFFNISLVSTSNIV